ncbi:MAG: cytochrome bc complex cytochrome b subunit [Anaerolineales bacterium]|jgi:quinol-cytochrome oxidoreductase complex cytochrome b subunit
MMWAKIGDWLDERFHWRQVWEAIFLRKIPHVNWFYTLGGATLFVAIMQGVTGILLTMYYVPDPTRAYDSVTYITTQLPMGWFIRGLHHWGASAMVVLVVAHMLRVFFYGAYKYPREMTWITGVLLFLVVIGFGFTGYLLPWDQKAYWATTVGTQIAGLAPFVGGWILRIARGGPDLSAVTLARFFGTHVWVLPASLATLIGVHLYLIIRIGISAVPEKGE